MIILPFQRLYLVLVLSAKKGLTKVNGRSAGIDMGAQLHLNQIGVHECGL